MFEVQVPCRSGRRAVTTLRILMFLYPWFDIVGGITANNV